MKDFFKYMMATICGIIVLTVVGILILSLTVAGMLAGSDVKVKAKENSVFVLKMNGTVDERCEGAGPLDVLLSSADMEMMGLDDILEAIRKARDEENIKGIYIEGGVTTFDAPATAQQIRDALLDFKKSGKWVYAYADQMLQASYYVLSAADSLFLNKTGMIDFKGLGGKDYYLTGLYEKLGIKYQCARVGKYKSAVESVTRKDMSEADREQREALWNGIWQQWTRQMADSRKVTAQQLDELASDSIMLFACVDDYKTSGLIDRAIYPDEMKRVVCRKMGLNDDESVNKLFLEDMLNLKPEKKEKKRGGQVAVYYAYGEIVDEVINNFYGGSTILGSKVVDDLQLLAKDDAVKALVLRVNSPGGSAVASEQIWHALQQLKLKKPVVVSMGGLAASGGYMISCGANYIIAEPSTVTGSIGIYGLVPNFSALVTDKLGVTWDGASTNAYTDYETNLVFGPDNSKEMQYLQSYTDRGYDNFISLVAQGRGMTKEQVNEIAQGRVWLATDAIGINLVDQLGSLNDAVAKAAELAHLDEYHPVSYPAKKDWLEELVSEQQQKSYLNGQLRQLLGEFYEPIMQLRLDQQRSCLQARLPYTVKIQ